MGGPDIGAPQFGVGSLDPLPDRVNVLPVERGAGETTVQQRIVCVRHPRASVRYRSMAGFRSRRRHGRTGGNPEDPHAGDTGHGVALDTLSPIYAGEPPAPSPLSRVSSEDRAAGGAGSSMARTSSMPADI